MKSRQNTPHGANTGTAAALVDRDGAPALRRRMIDDSLVCRGAPVAVRIHTRERAFREPRTSQSSWRRDRSPSELNQ